jgi:very-short-patch-repair endonuclease
MGEGKHHECSIELDCFFIPSPTKWERARVRAILWRDILIAEESSTKAQKNLTDVENKLWSQLRGRQFSGVKFRRQHPIGPFIVDFCCVERALVVELDGSQHAERSAADERRTIFIERSGYRVLRFWDNEVLSNLYGVFERISEALEDPRPLPS